MKQQVEAARSAYRLWRSDSWAGTVAAIVLVVVFLGPLAYRLWRSSRR